jgi:hypothetical protein
MRDVNRKIPIWFLIVPDDKPVRCSYCGKRGDSKDFVYIEQAHGLPDIIIHRSCVSEKWLASHTQGKPHKIRTPAKVWWTKEHKLRLVKG